LAPSVGLAVDPAEVGLNHEFGNSKSLCDLGYSTDFDDCEQHSQSHRRELVGLGNRFQRRRRIKRCPELKQRSRGCLSATPDLWTSLNLSLPKSTSLTVADYLGGMPKSQSRKSRGDGNASESGRVKFR
jgi:hypothetical protein